MSVALHIAIYVLAAVGALTLARHDLEVAQHELVLDELWLDCDDWIEAA